MSELPTGFVLALDCPDRPGIVHAVSGFLLERQGNITESQQYGDPDGGRFFMRIAFELPQPESTAVLREQFATQVAEAFAMDFELRSPAAPYRALVMVSQHLHCLNDLLFRQSTGSLPVEIAAVVSNHRDAESLVRGYGLDFRHVPVTRETKADAEAELLRLHAELDVDLVVLARYMQVLGEDVCRRLEGGIINIHHSFLPSFKGAKPYHQAHDRGVKLVGATAHYVTSDLDEGPIIEQDVVRVDHAHDQAALVAAGRDVEEAVLARAVRWHAESRVRLNGHRTVVFR